MDFIIRRATEADYPQVLTLIQEFSLFQGTPEKVTVTVEQMREEDDLFQCFLAERDGTVAGFASFFFAYYSWTGKALYLDDLYVREAFRQQGIGKKLLASLIDLARQERCRKVRWQVSKWNTSAIGFYQSIGATIDDVEINCDLVLTSK